MLTVTLTVKTTCCSHTWFRVRNNTGGTPVKPSKHIALAMAGFSSNHQDVLLSPYPVAPGSPNVSNALFWGLLPAKPDWT